MALLSDDGDFYARAGITWLLSANVAFAIIWGWIRGHGFRSKLLHFIVLLYGIHLGRNALKLRAFLAYIPEAVPPVQMPRTRRRRAWECILMEEAYVRDLVRVATSSFHLVVIVVLVIWEKRRPPRPRVPGWGCLGSIFIEILLFILCVLTCVHSVPALVLDYMAATANRGGAAVP